METDYATGDSSLSVKRYYRSIQRGRANSADHELPGLGFAWHGIVPGRIIISGDHEEMAEFHNVDGTIDFFRALGDTSYLIFTQQGTSSLRLQMLATPTTNRYDYFQTDPSIPNGPAEVRLDFGNGEYILFRRSDVFRAVATVHYLIPIEHGFPGGYKQWFDYPDTGEYPTKIRDSFGRQILIDWQDVTYVGGGATYKVVTGLHLPDGTSLAYQYDIPRYNSAGQPQGYSGNIQDRLIAAKHLDAAGTLLWQHGYLYEDPRFPYAMTGILDQNGQSLAAFSYSAAGLAISTELAGGYDKYTIDYLQDAPSQPLQHYVRTVTGPLGQVETYTFFHDELALPGMASTLMRIDRAASPTVPASSRIFNYTNTNNSDFLLSSVQDWRGNSTALPAMDVANRRPTSITEAQGTSAARTTAITWHPQYNLPTHEERQGLTVDYSYDATGQLHIRTETDTTSQTVPYSTNGQTRTVTYNWDNGRLTSVDGPLAPDAQGHDDIVTFAYGANGNLTSMTDGLGHATSYDDYDANGRPKTMTDMNGIVTTLDYNALGRVKTITVKHPSAASLNAVTSIDYDQESRVVGITLPATEKLIFDYNAAGLVTAMRSADGERVDYTYDAMGNVTNATVKRTDGSVAQSIVRTFDSLGRVLTEALGPFRVRHWAYDANGNATTLTNPSNNATAQAFDPLDRLMSTVAPDGGTTALAYDQKDGIVQNTDPKSVVTTFVRDGFGEVIQEVSPDRGTSTYWYDAAGKVTRSQDGRGQVVDYSRDILGRVTQKVPQAHPSETVTYSWDAGGLPGSYGVGRLGAITDASGTTQFAYDHRGNMIVQQQVIGTSTAAQLAYAYDLGDRVTQITYPSGRIVQYGRDTKGRVNLVQTKASASIGSWTAIASNITYEPFAAMKAMQLGNGLAVANDWGNDGRLASRRLYRTADGTNLSWLTYGYDPNDNIAAIVDQLDSTRSLYYGYDANDRLAMSASTASTVTPGTDSYSYSTGTNQLASVSGTAGTRTFGYDARGNLASENRAGSVSATTAYDSYARLVSYTRTDVGTLSFVYNGRDDRVAMTSGTAGTREFIYDPDGRVLGEYGASAADVKAEFVWALPEVANDNASFSGNDGTGGYMPLAVATPDSGGTVVLNWVHGNHLGVPFVTTDASGNAATTPNDYRAPGFPGQSRVLADLYYNRYRDYEPTTGRYIQADPIGLRGGQNNYAYAENNPIRITDPMGLNPVAGAIAGAEWGAPAGPWGAAAGAAGGAAAALCLALPTCRDAVGNAARRIVKACSDDDNGDACTAGWMDEVDNYCAKTFSGGAYRRCVSRANDRLRACKRDGGHWPPNGPGRWSRQDEHRFRP